MEVVWKFNTEKDAEDLKTLTRIRDHGDQALFTIQDYDNFLRNMIKYSNDLTDEQLAVYQKCRDRLWEIARERGVEG